MKKNSKNGGPFPTVAAPPLPGVLVRNSRLSSEYIRENFDTINTPVIIELDPSFNDMLTNWSEKELLNERRLVLLTVERDGCSVFRLKCEAVPPDYGVIEKDSLVISCIRWAEKDTHVLTSVDLLQVLENLVGETFSTQEKSRIRRNLQFLRPITVNRTSSARLFNAVMAMDNPRPRNIEKDLKVFRWLSLYVALTKVLSKYSVNPSISSERKILLEEVAKQAEQANGTRKDNGNGNSNGNGSSTGFVPLRKNSGNLRAEVPAVTTAPLPVNSLTALPRNIATTAARPVAKDGRPRPRPAPKQQPPNNQVGASTSWARIYMEQGVPRYACPLSVF